MKSKYYDASQQNQYMILVILKKSIIIIITPLLVCLWIISSCIGFMIDLFYNTNNRYETLSIQSP